MNLDFTSENINDICILICLGYTKLFSSKKKFKTYDEISYELDFHNSNFESSKLFLVLKYNILLFL